jgi:hypothetical protein
MLDCGHFGTSHLRPTMCPQVNQNISACKILLKHNKKPTPESKMSTPGQLSMVLFQLGVGLVAIVPRLPNDPPFPFAIGGDLSFNFRRVMLGLTLCHIIRHLFEETKVGVIRYPLKTLESFLRSFLCLLTPYLMQCQLQNRINILQPGRDLMMWVYAVVAFNVLGCIMLVATDDVSYWSIKKFGDALSFLPVYKTLKLYGSIITPGGRYPRRGDMMFQTLYMVEWLTVIATLLSVVGYVHSKDSHPIFEAFRQIGAYAIMTRLLCHAMLMNSKDEAEYLHKFATTFQDRENEETEPFRSSSDALVSCLESCPLCFIRCNQTLANRTLCLPYAGEFSIGDDHLRRTSFDCTSTTRHDF